MGCGGPEKLDTFWDSFEGTILKLSENAPPGEGDIEDKVLIYPLTAPRERPRTR
jgi:hypothetical protein